MVLGVLMNTEQYSSVVMSEGLQVQMELVLLRVNPHSSRDEF